MVITVERNNTYFIWLSFFLYATITSIAVQFVVLPYFYPALHAGDGLMRTLDSPEFHLKALETYTSSQKIGWSAWPLSGESRGIVNVISFFYIATGVAKPWVLIPLNAFLHASAGTLLFVLYRRFFASTTSAATLTISSTATSTTAATTTSASRMHGNIVMRIRFAKVLFLFA